jgi:hypothetical protein
MSFGGFTVGLNHQDRPAVSGILVSSGSAAIFVRLEPNGLLYLASFADESLGDASC